MIDEDEIGGKVEICDDEIAPEISVDRGQPVIVTIQFGAGDPDNGIYFSYLQPQSERPHVDDGYGQLHSRIEHLGNPGDGIYRYTIDTTDFESGTGDWHFWGEWLTQTRQRPYTRAHRRGVYRVRPSPKQLL